MGIGIFVPFKNAIHDFFALRDEAIALWRAEDERANGLVSKDWGSVGLLPNPLRDFAYTKEWIDFYSSEKVPPNFGDTLEARPILRNGLLNIEWPPSLDADFLLATANVPRAQGGNRGSYPTVEEITESFANVDFSYFRENTAAGIETFQDKSIQKDV